MVKHAEKVRVISFAGGTFYERSRLGVENSPGIAKR